MEDKKPVPGKPANNPRRGGSWVQGADGSLTPSADNPITKRKPATPKPSKPNPTTPAKAEASDGESGD